MNIRRRISGILSLLILVLGFQLQDCNAATPPAEYEVWDLVPRNVLRDKDGEVFIIDAEIAKK